MKTAVALGVVLLFGTTVTANATVIIDSASNTTFSTPQATDPFFSLGFNSEISDRFGTNTSTRLPHVSINALGNGSVDYYLFEVFNAGDLGIFDIDDGLGGAHGWVNTQLALWSRDGTLLASNDDGSFARGDEGPTFFGWDPFIEYRFSDIGQYLIGVDQTGTAAGTGGWQAPTQGIPVNTDYRLHISIENHPVPNPATLPLFIAGLLWLLFFHAYARISDTRSCVPRPHDC